MKLNPVTSLIAICLSALIAYGFYNFNDNEHKEILAYGSFFMLSFVLLFIIGRRYNSFGTAVNIRVVSLIFFAAVFAVHLLFSFITFSVPSYIVTNGILFLLYLLIIYFLSRHRI